MTGPLGITVSEPTPLEVGPPAPDGPYVAQSEKGAAGGVATLDIGGDLPESQLPLTVARDSHVEAFNAKKFGLVDGASEEQVHAKLLEALEAGIEEGHPIFLPPRLEPSKAWTLSEPLVIPGSGSCFRGLRGQTRLKAGFGAAKNAIIQNVQGIANVTIADLLLDRTGTYCNGIQLLGVDGVMLANVQGDGAPVASGASGFINIGGFVNPQAGDLCTDITVVNCYGTECDNFGVQLGWVNTAKLLAVKSFGQHREAIGIEPGVGAIAQDIVIHGASLWGGTYNGGGTQTGLLVLTETSGGTIKDVLISDSKIFGATEYFARYGEGRGEAAAIAGSVMPGLTVLMADASSTRVRNLLTRATDGPGVSVGSAGTPTSALTIEGLRVQDPNQGENEENGTGRASAIGLREAKKTVIRNGQISGENHTNSIYESSNAAENTIVEFDPGSKPLSVGSTFKRRDKIRAKNEEGAQIEDHVIRARHSRLHVEKTCEKETPFNICGVTSASGSVSVYAGEITVIVRQSESDSTNTAIYRLLVGKHLSASAATLIASNGMTAGSGASWPSFTFTLNTETNQLVATPKGSTASTFHFHIQAEGDLTVAA